jgi:hypothetical protein
MIIGFLLIGVAMGFAVWKQMRLAAANPTTRLSGWDAPPPHPIVQPSGTRLLNGAVVGFMLAANFRLQDANGHGWLWLLLIGSSLFRVGGLVDLEPCCDRFRWCRRAG